MPAIGYSARWLSKSDSLQQAVEKGRFPHTGAAVLFGVLFACSCGQKREKSENILCKLEKVAIIVLRDQKCDRNGRIYRLIWSVKGIIAMKRTLNKQGVVEAVTAKTGLVGEEARAAVEAALETVIEAIGRGETVHIAGFGRFETYERKSRAGSHPRTHEPITIPAAKMPVFRPSERLRERFKTK